METRELRLERDFGCGWVDVRQRPSDRAEALRECTRLLGDGNHSVRVLENGEELCVRRTEIWDWAYAGTDPHPEGRR